MIGDTFKIDGALFSVRHLVDKHGLVHAALLTGRDRFWTPQHLEPQDIIYGAVETLEPVLTCLTCIQHQFKDTPQRHRIQEEYYDDDD